MHQSKALSWLLPSPLSSSPPAVRLRPAKSHFWVWEIIPRFGQAPNCWALSSVAGGSWWPGRARRGCGSCSTAAAAARLLCQPPSMPCQSVVGGRALQISAPRSSRCQLWVLPPYSRLPSTSTEGREVSWELREAKDKVLALTDHVYPTWPRPSSWWRFNFKVFDRSLASEAEHGYATTLPSPGEEDFHQNTSSTKNSTRLNKNTKKPQGNR